MVDNKNKSAILRKCFVSVLGLFKTCSLPPIYPSTYLSIYLSIHQPIYPSTYLLLLSLYTLMILLFIQKTLLCFFPSLLFSSLFNSRDILCCCYHFCICHFHLVFNSQSFYLFILYRLFDNSFLKGRLNLFTSFEFNKVTVGEISSLKLATIGLKLRTLGRKRQMYQKLPSTAISCPQCS